MYCTDKGRTQVATNLSPIITTNDVCAASLYIRYIINNIEQRSTQVTQIVMENESFLIILLNYYGVHISYFTMCIHIHVIYIQNQKDVICKTDTQYSWLFAIYRNLASNRSRKPFDDVCSSWYTIQWQYTLTSTTATSR